MQVIQETEFLGSILFQKTNESAPLFILLIFKEFDNLLQEWLVGSFTASPLQIRGEYFLGERLLMELLGSSCLNKLRILMNPDKLIVYLTLKFVKSLVVLSILYA